jgi:peptidoglycan hydrolase-like protein with peptidoglycan-binding domain
VTTETSQNGWTAIRENQAAAQTDVQLIPGSQRKIRLRKGDAGWLLRRIGSFIDQHVEDIDEPKQDDWGWNYRPNVNDPTSLSNHSSATAADYNAEKHPNGVHGTWSPSEIAAIHGHLEEYVDPVTGRNVIRWGEDYTKTVDGMHFEIVGTAAAVARVAAKLKAVPSTPAVLGAVVDMSNVQYAAAGGHFNSGQATALATARLFVRWCRRLGVASDRDLRVWETYVREDKWVAAGAQFSGIVRNLQRRYKLQVDGIFGPKTAAVMAHDGYRIVP